jgi:hypothetical protein
MAKIHDRVRANDFTLSTRLSPEQIRAAGARAAASGKRFLNNTITEKSASASGVEYQIKGPGNLVTQLGASLTWSAPGTDGSRTVRLETGTILTTRTTVMFIPVTPRMAPARVSYERFVAALRDELTGAVR